MDEGASFGSARLRAGHPRLFTALGTSIASVLKIYHDVPHIYPSEKKGGAGMMSTVFIYSCIVVVLARRKLSSGVFTCKVHRYVRRSFDKNIFNWLFFREEAARENCASRNAIEQNFKFNFL